MRFDKSSFGFIQIDGTVYGHDFIIDRGEIRKRKKKSSKKFREQFGHTPLSIDEEKKCPGDATNSSSAMVLRPTARDAREYSAKPNVTTSNCLSCPLSKPSRC